MLAALLVAVAAATAPAPVAGPLDVTALVDDVGEEDDVVLAARRSPRRSTRRTPTRPKAVSTASPVNIGLAAAGGAALGTAIGIAGVGTSGAFAIGTFGEQPTEVVVVTAGVAIGIAVATPFLAGLGGGLGVLLADPRTTATDWGGLASCASTGVCTGCSAIFGAATGGGISTSGCANMAPDKPAEWTAAAAAAGVVIGGGLGAAAGFVLAPDRSQLIAPMAIGAFAGGLLSTATFAGLAGGLSATMLR